MPVDYDAGPGGAWVRKGAQALLGDIDLLVFDIDGVLMDTSASYPEAISQAVQWYFSRVLKWPGNALLIHPADSALFKRAGGFNSDWELAMSAVLFYLAKAARVGAVDLEALRSAPPRLADFTAAVAQAGGGVTAAQRVALAGLPTHLKEGVLGDWDRDLIERICCELYGGEDWCEAMFGFAPKYLRTPGLFNRERPLLETNLLAGWSGHVGVYTGRVRREARPALERCGLSGRVPDALLACADGPHVKPDPGGLLHLARDTGARGGLFIGDNVDDLRTVLRYRAEAPAEAIPFGFAGVVDGSALGEGAAEVFRAGGADLLVPDVNAAVMAVLAAG